MNTIENQSILVIDDDETIREYLLCILEAEGYTVHEAENGLIGIEILEKQKVDIIITDLIMPEKEGIETIREIKNLRPDCRIIAMSGAVNRDNYLIITKALGADGIIKKPFSKETVIEAIGAIKVNR